MRQIFILITLQIALNVFTAVNCKAQSLSNTIGFDTSAHQPKQKDTEFLRDSADQLKQVVVTARKPLFVQKTDRLVINVKNDIANAAGTALDVLEKSPGVSVNRQSNSISINGKKGVQIMINGKINYIPADGIVDLLQSIGAENIERIELITAPSSNYDAAGNGGYINIILNNNPYQGSNGSYYLSAGYGKKELGSAGFNYNYRSARLSIFANYDFQHLHFIQPSSGITQIKNSQAIIENNTFTDRDAIRNVHNARVGIEFRPDKSNSFGAIIGGYDSRWTMDANNGSATTINNKIDTSISTTDHELNHWNNLLANINFQHVFRPGQTLQADANYVYYKDENPNTYFSKFYNGSKQLLYNENTRSGKVTPIQFKVFSVDYTSTLNSQITMETGAKVSLSNFENKITAEKLEQNNWVPIPEQSGSYFLKENIAAAYSSLTWNLPGKIVLKGGLRYEYTTSKLNTAEKQNIVDRNYGELFPTFYLSKKISTEKALSFSYARRITRPAFTDLAPFTIFFDPKTFFSGNPALQPAISNSVQLNYTLRNLNFSISYTYEKNSIENFYFKTQKVDTSTGVVFLSASNFKYEKYLTPAVSFPVSITRWWTMQNSVSANYREVSTSYENKAVLLKYVDFKASTSQRFALPKEISFELTGIYSAPTYYGTTKSRSTYQLDAGIQKKFANKKDILRFTATDIFNSGNYYRLSETLLIPGVSVNRIFSFGNVGYKISYAHNFGNRSLKVKTQKSTSAEDEIKRVRN